MGENSEGLTQAFADIEEFLCAAIDAVKKAAGGELIFLGDAQKELAYVERAKLRFFCALRQLILDMVDVQHKTADTYINLTEVVDRRQLKVEQQLYALTDAVLKLAKVNEIQVDVEARETDDQSEEMQYV